MSRQESKYKAQTKRQQYGQISVWHHYFSYLYTKKNDVTTHEIARLENNTKQKTHSLGGPLRLCSWLLLWFAVV